MDIGILVKNRYRILENIGTGTFSEVYLAHDIALERKVTLKVFKNLDKPITARIQREAQLFGQIDHPNIVRLYDVFIDNDKIHLVLQYIDGEALSEKLLNNNLTIHEALLYASDIFESLYYIHTKGIIHRDIKPSNIIIRTEDNCAILTDFNTGKSLADETSITQDGGLIGTIAYMSTEQLEGTDPSTSADIYSAGIVLYEMLFNKLPYDYKNISDLITQIRNEDVSKSMAIEDKIPERLLQLLRNLLNKDPQKRLNASQAFSEIQEIFVNAQENKNLNLDIKLSPESGNDNYREPIESRTILLTQLTNKEAAKPSGFFADELSRFKEFNKSVEFFRTHLDHDFDTLLKQAKISFWLWFSFAAISFIVIIIGIVLLFQNKLVAGSITMISDVLVIFIQRLFKDREEYYRNKAEIKQNHLELGNIWNLSLQSVDGITDPVLREQKLSDVIDVLVQRVKNNFPSSKQQ